MLSCVIRSQSLYSSDQETTVFSSRPYTQQPNHEQRSAVNHDISPQITKLITGKPSYEKYFIVVYSWPKCYPRYTLASHKGALVHLYIQFVCI